MRSARFTALAFAVVCLAPLAEGQNLVSNSGFDTDVTGWSPFLMASIAWSSLDATAAPSSGSAFLTNSSTTAIDGTGARQCIDGLGGGLRYRISADILVPGGQSTTGEAYLLVQWYDQPGCGGGNLGLFTSPAIMTSTPDVWYTSVESGEAPTGTQSARLRLSIIKIEDSGSLDANFDNVEFIEHIFSDGFESGDTTAWTSAVGLPMAYINWYSDNMCSVMGPSGGPLGPDDCFQVPGETIYTKFDCSAASFDWYWDAQCTNHRANGCPPGVCCVAPFAATFEALVYSCF